MEYSSNHANENASFRRVGSEALSELELNTATRCSPIHDVSCIRGSKTDSCTLYSDSVLSQALSQSLHQVIIKASHAQPFAHFPPAMNRHNIRVISDQPLTIRVVEEMACNM